jgi:hypothetical protein
MFGHIHIYSFRTLELLSVNKRAGDGQLGIAWVETSDQITPFLWWEAVVLLYDNRHSGIHRLWKMVHFQGYWRKEIIIFSKYINMGPNLLFCGVAAGICICKGILNPVLTHCSTCYNINGSNARTYMIQLNE